MKNGNLFIISAPSGTGKTTILKRVIAELKNIVFSVSHTTRSPRLGEEKDVDYFFVDKSTFVTMQEQGLFLEWAEVHGNLYGTCSNTVQAITEQGIDIILDIDVQGARQLMDKLNNKGVFVFISPPSLHELEKRLVNRGTESDSVIATRLNNAHDEMKSLEYYDYVIVNDRVDQAVDELKSIIIAERSRKRRGISGEPLNLDI
ncbi:MAG: guanylate kinase [Desulfobacterales bacterium]|jgi:guanylate kinase|nr:guanylate kinase [Desulfobacterales bacterium]